MEETEKENVSKLDTNLGKDESKRLLLQIKSEKDSAYNDQNANIKEGVSRLKLFNNKLRSKTKVGDNTVFSYVMTTVSTLYDDKLTQEFLPREPGDENAAENLNLLAEADYEQMNMELVNYEMIFNTVFFSHAVCDLSEFNRDTTTIPHPISPLILLRDPAATSIHGTNGSGAARFWGYFVTYTKAEVEKFEDFINQDKMEVSTGDTDMEQNLKQVRINQKFLGTSADKVDGENKAYKFFYWNTFFNGKRVRVLVDSECKYIYRYLVLPNQDMWSAFDLVINPIPGAWDWVSVVDLTEDKQRHKAVVLNSALSLVKRTGNPSYMVDISRVSIEDVGRSNEGNIIPSKGSAAGAVELLPQETPGNDVAFILTTLDSQAQQSTATPSISQGVTEATKRTATELVKIGEGSNQRYGLTAKLFGYGWRIFWQIWYRNYKEYFADKIDERVLRLSSSMGEPWRTLTRENIIANVDPDVRVESKVIVASENQAKAQNLMAYFPLASKDPSFNSQECLKMIGRKIGLTNEDISILFAPSIDEIEARNENVLLNEDKLEGEDGRVEIKIEQNHDIHLREHSKANKTDTTMKHIKAHEKAKLLQRDNPNIPKALTPNQVIGANVQGITPKDTQVNNQPRLWV